MHIAIILDGNRRYAKKIGLEAWKGHEKGAAKVEDLMDWAQELDVKELTLYSFSIENFKRPEKEKKVLLELFRKYLERLMKDERITKNKIKIKFIGRIWMFPDGIIKKMDEIMGMSAGNDNFTVNFAMAYGGRQEILDAVKKIASDVEEGRLKAENIDEEMITDNLYLTEEPDMIIRPGGERRVSNFLIWQGNYSEWYFTDKLWPEFTKDDLKEAIDEFLKRERRFGR